MNTTALEVRAHLATQVNLVVTDHGWRLTFGEAVDEKNSQYHTAVFLPTETAHQLSELMADSARKQKGESNDRDDKKGG